VAEKKHSFFYDWGSVTTYLSDISSQELVSRASGSSTCGGGDFSLRGGGLLAAAGVAPANVNALDFVITAAFLSITNLAYTIIGRNLFGDKSAAVSCSFFCCGR